ncbi:uncharacterized protein EV154DRAFT_478301 [Mucor mucedo]|uniref:uncharacterized protein n=1 Tax=Mucor mucedo TaxID=29922 RepID=UPI002220CC6D|nr:uncharacterized protein EV154DRAFT_478301 [Mucor mucedo]KAI7894627.1 hypothetical protein EV154DRAFT_478301 [Mucor mucedo]
MIKKVVIKKKRDVLSKINTKEDDDHFKDCHEEGHVNKKYFKCLFYREASAYDVRRRGERLTRVRQSKYVEVANKQAINKGPKIAPITILLKRRNILYPANTTRILLFQYADNVIFMKRRVVEFFAAKNVKDVTKGCECCQKYDDYIKGDLSNRKSVCSIAIILHKTLWLGELRFYSTVISLAEKREVFLIFSINYIPTVYLEFIGFEHRRRKVSEVIEKSYTHL